MKKRCLFLLFFVLMLNKGCVTDDELSFSTGSSFSSEDDFFSYGGVDEGMGELFGHL